MSVARKMLDDRNFPGGTSSVGPVDSNDVNSQSLGGRKQRTLDLAQTALDPVQLGRTYAPFWGWVVTARFHLDGAILAPAPSQDVDFTAGQPQVASDDAVSGAFQPATREVLAGLANRMGALTRRTISIRLRATCRIPRRVRHGRCATPRCDRTRCWRRQPGV